MKSTTKLTSESSSEGKHSEPFTYDPEFSGPVKNRSCTDIICLFLFISFMAGWVVVCFFAFMTGNPKVLLYPTDSEGNICGVGPFEDQPHLYFFNFLECASIKVLKHGCPTPQVCVSHCPNITEVITSSPDNQDVKDNLICKPNADRTRPLKELFDENACASIYLKSSVLMGRCIPVDLKSIGDNIADNHNHTLSDLKGKKLSLKAVRIASKMIALFLNAKESGKEMLSDLRLSWQLILLGLVFSMLLSLMWVILMRWVAGIMTWLSIILIFVLTAFASYFCAMEYLKIKNKREANVEFEENIQSFKYKQYTWLILSIVCGILTLVFFVILVFLRKRIQIAIAIIKEGSRAVGHLFMTLIFPVLPYLLEVILFVLWGTIAIYIAASGRPTYIVKTPKGSLTQNECDPATYNESGTCVFEDYGTSGNLFSAQFFNLFAFLWAVFFVDGFCQLALAGAFSAYYWKLDKKEVSNSCVLTSIYYCLRFHLGTVAFGSLLVSFIRIIRIMLEYIEAKCKRYENSFTKVLLCCCKCCFWMLEKFLRFVNKNAYIMVAVYGSNFCTSARIAVDLLFRNMVRVVVIDKVVNFLLLLGKLCVVGITGIISFFIFSGKVKDLSPYLPQLHYGLLPVFVIVFGAFVIATLFFDVYDMAVDTLFLCFLEDSERHDGSPEKPYYMSKELMKILGKKNKYRDA